MATLEEMLRMNGGSFQQAEQMALNFIAQGRKDVLLDLGLLMCAQGNFVGAKQMLNEYVKLFPDCPRAKFGLSWHALSDGDLEAGLQHIEAGRAMNCLGSTETELKKINAPRWDGHHDLNGKTILWYGEGGDGDQIMCFRSTQWLKKRGAKVLVACSKSLVGLFSKSPYVDVVVENNTVSGVRCDYYMPSMSCFHLFNCSWETLWTGQYIDQPINKIWNRIIPEGKNIAIRWRGLKDFEHEQLRLFPPELLFDATNRTEIQRWSVQKDDPTVTLPSDVENLEPLLGNWEQTAAALVRCDLIITSDTAIGHLAAAMNKPVWIVVPIMPYWPWARPGNKSYWYPAVRLFRQERFGSWIEPFAKIKEALKEL